MAEINYEDERFQTVETEKQEALNQVEQTYGQMAADSERFYEEQIQNSKDWAEEQTRLQQEQTDFAIEQIEQQKEAAQKDYTKEQSGAFVDWKKQSNQYGADAEQKAAMGMAGTGYSESSQVSMYNTYQIRVATAREVFSQAQLNYNNSIKEAMLQNDAVLAEIAAQALAEQEELALQGFQYKNQLLLEMENQKRTVENSFYGRYMDVVSQINQENALAEEIRQFNESMAEEQRQFNIANGIASGGSTGGSGSGGTPGAGSDKPQEGLRVDGGTEPNIEESSSQITQAAQGALHGASNSVPVLSAKPASVGKALEETAKKYPGGAVTDIKEWNNLVRQFGLPALVAKGLFYRVSRKREDTAVKNAPANIRVKNQVGNTIELPM